MTLGVCAYDEISLWPSRTPFFACSPKVYGTDETFVPSWCPTSVDATDHAQRTVSDINDKFKLGDGVDDVLECSGAEPCVQLAIFACKPGVTFVQAGIGKEIVAFLINALCTSGITVKGSIRYVVGAYPEAIELISSRNIEFKSLITNRFKFEECEEAFNLVKEVRSNFFKVMIQGVQG